MNWNAKRQFESEYSYKKAFVFLILSFFLYSAKAEVSTTSPTLHSFIQLMTTPAFIPPKILKNKNLESMIAK
jgi:hypothetical protein